MAPSTIPNAGIGVFTAVDLKEGERVGYPDQAIPVTDIDWHNGGNRHVSLQLPRRFVSILYVILLNSLTTIFVRRAITIGFGKM